MEFKMDYVDAIKQLMYTYLANVEYDDEKREKFIKEINEIIN